MSIALTHGGLTDGIGRFNLIDTFDAVARKVFGISATAIRLLMRHVSKCRDSDFLAGRICGTWEQPQQTAKLLGISTRVLNNAERELIAKGFVNRSATPHARRDGRRSGDKIAMLPELTLHHWLIDILNLRRFKQLRNCKRKRSFNCGASLSDHVGDKNCNFHHYIPFGFIY
jgi:hypothetical protein